jgi:hypothetical protein
MKISTSNLLAIAAAFALQLSVASGNIFAQTPAAVSAPSIEKQLQPARWLGNPAIVSADFSGQTTRVPGTRPRLDHFDPAGEPPWSWKHWWHPRRDMFLRHTYYPEAHGYYYMHPYNYKHIALHQEFARRWGGDPKNPYSNEIFKQLEEEP